METAGNEASLFGRFWQLPATLLLGLLLAACAASGDLGRVERDSISTSSVAGGPSGFNLTDDENEMQNRIWRFLDAPHSKPWFEPIATAMRQRGQPLRLRDEDVSELYYRMLQDTEYRSSRVRYVTVASDAQTDTALVPSVFDVICRVRTIDDRRQIAVAEIAGSDADMLRGVAQRRQENNWSVDRFTLALRFRYDAYSIALDRLLIETPHAEAWQVENNLSEMSYYLELAERGDFCPGSGMPIFKGMDAQTDALPSRVGRVQELPPILLGS